MIDDSDKKLKSLRSEMGIKVYEAVAKALREMSEYNPISRRPVSELWNFRESRKATLREGIAAILNLAEQRKRTKSVLHFSKKSSLVGLKWENGHIYG